MGGEALAGVLDSTFEHVHIFCTDLSATRQWLVDCLDAEPVGDRTVGGARASDLRLGGVSIFLREQQEGESFGEAGPSRFGTDHFGLRVADLDAAVQELKRRGAYIEMEPTQMNPKLRIAFVRGPDMVRIELVQRW